MTLRHLKMFVAVCETGSVTRASELLYIAQPTVSHAISELEKYYNVRLFDRINQRLILTETGRELLVSAKEILSDFESFERLASFGGQSPRVRIGASLTLGQTVVPPYLKRLGTEQPEIEAQLVIKTSASIQAEIENGDLDFAIVEGEISSPYLRAELFTRDKLVAVANSTSAPMSATIPAIISFFVPNLCTNAPKNRFTIAFATNRQVSFRENALLSMFRLSQTTSRYKLFVELQNPSVIMIIKKQTAITTHL